MPEDTPHAEQPGEPDPDGIRPPDPEKVYDDISRRGLRALRGANPDDAADLSQEVALELWMKEHADSAAGLKRALPPLVARAVKYRLINLIRDEGRAAEHLEQYETERAELSEYLSDPSVQLENRELEQLIARTLAKMTPERRETYLRVRDGGLTYEEIAAERGISVSAVNMHVVRAGKDLRAALSDYLG